MSFQHDAVLLDQNGMQFCCEVEGAVLTVAAYYTQASHLPHTAGVSRASSSSRPATQNYTVYMV